MLENTYDPLAAIPDEIRHASIVVLHGWARKRSIAAASESRSYAYLHRLATYLTRFGIIALCQLTLDTERDRIRWEGHCGQEYLYSGCEACLQAT